MPVPEVVTRDGQGFFYAHHKVNLAPTTLLLPCHGRRFRGR